MKPGQFVRYTKIAPNGAHLPPKIVRDGVGAAATGDFHPLAGKIQVPIARGENGVFEVLDAAGRLVKKYKVDPIHSTLIQTFPVISLPPSKLPNILEQRRQLALRNAQTQTAVAWEALSVGPNTLQATQAKIHTAAAAIEAARRLGLNVAQTASMDGLYRQLADINSRVKTGGGDGSAPGASARNQDLASLATQWNNAQFVSSTFLQTNVIGTATQGFNSVQIMSKVADDALRAVAALKSRVVSMNSVLAKLLDLTNPAKTAQNRVSWMEIGHQLYGARALSWTPDQISNKVLNDVKAMRVESERWLTGNAANIRTVVAAYRTAAREEKHMNDNGLFDKMTTVLTLLGAGLSLAGTAGSAAASVFSMLARKKAVAERLGQVGATEAKLLNQKAALSAATAEEEKFQNMIRTGVYPPNMPPAVARQKYDAAVASRTSAEKTIAATDGSLAVNRDSYALSNALYTIGRAQLYGWIAALTGSTTTFGRNVLAAQQPGIPAEAWKTYAARAVANARAVQTGSSGANIKNDSQLAALLTTHNLLSSGAWQTFAKALRNMYEVIVQRQPELFRIPPARTGWTSAGGPIPSRISGDVNVWYKRQLQTFINNATIDKNHGGFVYGYVGYAEKFSYLFKDYHRNPQIAIYRIPVPILAAFPYADNWNG